MATVTEKLVPTENEPGAQVVFSLSGYRVADLCGERSPAVAPGERLCLGGIECAGGRQDGFQTAAAGRNRNQFHEYTRSARRRSQPRPVQRVWCGCWRFQQRRIAGPLFL